MGHGSFKRYLHVTIQQAYILNIAKRGPFWGQISPKQLTLMERAMQQVHAYILLANSVFGIIFTYLGVTAKVG